MTSSMFYPLVRPTHTGDTIAYSFFRAVMHVHVRRRRGHSYC